MTARPSSDKSRASPSRASCSDRKYATSMKRSSSNHSVKPPRMSGRSLRRIGSARSIAGRAAAGHHDPRTPGRSLHRPIRHPSRRRPRTIRRTPPAPRGLARARTATRPGRGGRCSVGRRLRSRIARREPTRDPASHQQWNRGTLWHRDALPCPIGPAQRGWRTSRRPRHGSAVRTRHHLKCLPTAGATGGALVRHPDPGSVPNDGSRARSGGTERDRTPSARSA